MPILPMQLTINTEQQFKAISDSLRTRILGIVQHQPATAKQIADRLGAPPGAIGHHLKVLEEAGLVQVVARRLIRGIVASYYTRTARMYNFDLPPEISGTDIVGFDFFKAAREEYVAALDIAQPNSMMGFPHARLSRERALHYTERLQALVDDFLNEPVDAAGEVYGMFYAAFKSPAYVQPVNQPSNHEGVSENE
ncbi:MAG TPA: winged helix-turn-helix domain-containing protein [Anaerolineae bacterium]